MSPGQKAKLDFMLPAEAVFGVRGRITDDGPGGLSVRLRLRNSVGLEQEWMSVVDSNHAFAFHGIPAGEYMLEVDSHQPHSDGSDDARFARLPVSVAGDLADVEVRLQPSARLHATFRSPAGTMLAGNVDPLILIPANGDLPVGHPFIQAERSADGSQIFRAVVAGDYWLQTRTSNSTCIVAAAIEKKNLSGRLLHLSASADLHLDLTLSTRCAAISVKVNTGRKPFPVTRLVVLLSGTPEQPGDAWTDILTENEDSVTLLSAGRYWAWAWPEEGSGPFTGPESLKAAANYATVVDITEGEPTKIEIPLHDSIGEVK
jgi:hypothetical protein